MRKTDRIRLRIHRKVPHHKAMAYLDVMDYLEYNDRAPNILAIRQTLRYMEALGEAQYYNPKHESRGLWIILDKTEIQPVKIGVFDA